MAVEEELEVNANEGVSGAPQFGDELSFLEQHTEIHVLADASGSAMVAVAPEYQARVMTSSSNGKNGLSYGWLNRELIASGERRAHINAFGGEDRFWLGPEGGQYSIFFKPGDPFDLEHWQTPEAIDWGAWELASRTEHSLNFAKSISLVNYSETSFSLGVERTIRLLNPNEIVSALSGLSDMTSLTNLTGLTRVTEPAAGIDFTSVPSVAFESHNTVTNTGAAPWTRETGLLSVWILGMFQPSDDTVIIVPFHQGSVEELGPIVNDAYFGKVPEARLQTFERVLLFRGDGKYRSKIGLSPTRALAYVASYAVGTATLTLVTYSLPNEAKPYVNSMWEIQDEPYAGDVVNSYNDGPPKPGAKPLGPFYELETSSQAAALDPGQTLSHVHRTFHFELSDELADDWLGPLFGVSVADLKRSLN